MEKTIIKKYCDICGRDCGNVGPYNGYVGSGHLCFALTAGANCGGATDRYDADDLCIECAWKIREALRDVWKKCINLED